MPFRMTISRAIVVFGLAVVLGLAALIGTSNFALQHMKVGGPLYDQIKLGNDLIADILPPPEYVIEAYLEATLAVRDPASHAERRERLAQLKKDYDDRREFWSKSDLGPALKSLLVEKSHADVTKFWKAVDDGLLPALAAGKADAAGKPMTRRPRLTRPIAPSSTTSSRRPPMPTPPPRPARRRRSRRSPSRCGSSRRWWCS